ncbi:NTP transferase domain-containing protein [Ectopseudomonas composti]
MSENWLCSMGWHLGELHETNSIMVKTDSAPPGVILLSAGRGSRMLPLTDGIPKSLLPVGDRLVLDWLAEAVIARTSGEVVVVTGYGEEKLASHVIERFGSRITLAHNDRYEQDVNILSVDIGVSALHHPERGYLIVETDLLLDESAWDQVFEVTRANEGLSCWVCDGVYGPHLTGGIVHACTQGRIDAVDYQPVYSPEYDGWPKMVGLLLVSPEQVEEDCRLRRAAIEQSIGQYYLMPWREGIASLPCRVLQLKDAFARSFNTAIEYQRACASFLATRHCSPNNIENKVVSE